jgi:hypothetical protein
MILAAILGFILMRRVIGSKGLSDASASLAGELKMMFQRLIKSSAGSEAPRRQIRAKKHDK